MFDRFEKFDIATTATVIHGRKGGQGPPVLLLHGIPETHLMWHRVAPELARHFTVVATDLRGYGDSGKPPSTPDHRPYSMREIAVDQVEVMGALGYERFAVVGHDRGARCAYRLAADHPQRVTGLAVLDILPTGQTFRAADLEFAMSYWVWSFLSAPEPIPERLVAGEPEMIVDYMLDTWSASPGAFPDEVRAEYRAKFRDADTVHAICEEYRAAATLDRRHDEQDRGKRPIACPTLVLWSEVGTISGLGDPLEVWRGWASQVSGGPVKAGHFLAEEAPQETAQRLLQFLKP
jgi:haloacetate dehalogenase